MAHQKYSNYNEVTSEINKEGYKNKASSARYWEGCSEAFKKSKHQYSMTYMEFKKLWRNKKKRQKILEEISSST